MTKKRASPHSADAALSVARERSKATSVIELSTGYRARLVPVAGFLLTEVASRIQDPEVPMWANPEKEGREESNPSDPGYLRALAAAERHRAEAVIDAMLLFGVVIEGDLPDREEWMPKIQKMVKLGHLDLDGFNLEDPLDTEFLFKRYVAVAANDLQEIMSRSGVTQEAIALAAKSFPGDEAR